MTEADVPCVCAPDARSLPTAVYLRHQGCRETQGDTGRNREKRARGVRDSETRLQVGASA